MVGASALLLAGCGQSSKIDAKPADVDYYTCTMHPSVKSQDPHGKCPICSMDLVPVLKKDAAAAATAAASTTGGEEKPSDFTVAEDRQQLIGVTYTEARKTPLQTTLRTTGLVAIDRLRHWDYVSRVEGYVKDLAVVSRGESVRKGQALVTIYSPDLLTTQQEFVNSLNVLDYAHKSGAADAIANAEGLVQSVRRRMELWNITAEQIQALEKSRVAQDTLTLYSPFDGVVLEIMTNQGSRVAPGDHLVDVVDLSAVWVWAEFYQEELPLLKPGVQVTISSSANRGETLAGKIAVVDPILDEVKRTVRVRIDVDNPDRKLLPNMYVDVELQLDQGEGLTIPVSAVLPTGQHNLVFVDKGEGKLEPRYIELGRKFGDRYQVTSGLKEGERIVNSANFLIDAESKVQGALKSF